MNEQDTNKEYLAKLLSFLKERIMFMPENHWFSAELYKLLAPASDQKISDIHEQCIEDVLRSQAEDFYKDFILPEIRQQLIRDFVKMERSRRRNDICEFGLAVYQQIEAIINRLIQNRFLSDVSLAMMDAPAYVEEKEDDGKTYKKELEVDKRSKNSTYTIGQFLFIEKEQEKKHKILLEHTARDQFRCISYFICHKACLTKSIFNQFTEEYRIFNSLITLRNAAVHHGNDLADWEKPIIADIQSHTTRSFLTYISFLNWFVGSVNTGFPISEKLITYSKCSFETPVASTPAIGVTVIGKIDLPMDTSRKRK